jgi:hypothetical protein
MPKASYPCMKQGSLFCFVCHFEIFQTMLLHVTILVPSESFDDYGCIDVVWDCLEQQCGNHWLLKHFPNDKFFKIKAKNCIIIWGCSWCYWKALGESNLIDFISQFSIFISQFSELRCGRYWFLSEICWCKLKQIAKIEIESKNQLSHQCVHIAEFRKFQN